MGSNKWLEEPETYYPDPVTLQNVLRWHVALMGKIDQIRKADRPSKGQKVMLIPMSEVTCSSDADKLYDRDRAFIRSLGYDAVAKIEAAMMLGRELYYRNRNGYSDYEQEIQDIGLENLEQWMDVFDIPASVDKGGNINLAIEYTLSKIPVFLQCYVTAIERGGVACISSR